MLAHLNSSTLPVMYVRVTQSFSLIQKPIFFLSPFLCTIGSPFGP